MLNFFLPALRRNLLFLGLAFGLVGLYVAASGGGFPLDDSWIHQTYGRNLAQHGEWAFIPGIPSAASTSPLYTVILSIGYKLNIPYALWTHGIGALALAFTAMLGAWLAERAAPQLKHAPLFTGLTLLLTWHLIWAAASGMETGIFGMLTLALIALAWRVIPLPASQQSENIRGGVLSGFIFGIVAALTMLARPEGILLAGMAGLLVLLAHRGGWRSGVIQAFGAAIGFAVCSAPYLLLNLQLTGGLLPNTANAKFEQHAHLLALPLPVRLWELFVAIMAGGQLLLIPGMIFYLTPKGSVYAPRRPHQLERGQGREVRFSAPLRFMIFMLPLLWAMGLIVVYALRLPASYQHGRYVIPALPALVTVGVIGTMALVQQARRSLLPRVLSRALVATAALLFLFFGFLQGVQIYRVDVAIINGEMVAAAHWIRDNLPENELLAIHDIGAVGYFAPRPMLDIAGLISPEVIPFVDEPERMWTYIQQANARYLLAFPNQIPGRNPDDPRLCPIYSTNAAITQSVGERNMAIYALVYDGDCLPFP
jgi:hypothetical protein